MRLARLTIPAALVCMAGCTLFVELDGFVVPEQLPSDGGRDGSLSREDVVTDATTTSDGSEVTPKSDAGEPDADAAPSATTEVACGEPSSCAAREGCCIVYQNVSDFCAKRQEDCVYGTAMVTFATCDDPTDCAALGAPGTVCCATVVDERFQTISCRLREQCAGIELCDAKLQKCPNGKTCVRSTYSSDMWECK